MHIQRGDGGCNDRKVAKIMKQLLLDTLDVLKMFLLAGLLVYSPIIGIRCAIWWHCGFEAVMEILTEIFK